MSNEAPLLEVRNLTKHFPVGHGKEVHAVNGVSFTLEKGETLGIVGESGCGKSTLAKAIMKLVDIKSGEIFVNNQNILEKSNSKDFYKSIQMIFQNPYASLNPKMKLVAYN